ncbi:DNA polymerase III beta subunit [Alloactinosynnema sp. L-07]|uniref:DNA polymerase III subunit beta n=1 Tax=Alloactinosynnema sp. L-07 TaxID=1653480 RepID=UPI00065EFED1|nr:DNA polymerase III subunit beta [Alloactinosynnema sp. L-07]CRK61048.1 DNA polymerase III beta subunit [Alloactinosynnema sp. L-07]
MDLTITTAELATAAADVIRLVPGKLVDPVLSGLLLTATAQGVELAANDRERTARVTCDALVHSEGQILVPAKPLAETLKALEQPQVRLVVEGTRLAIRAEGARFALPLLDVELHPGVPSPPAAGGSVSARLLASALSTVAATAARDEALPIFTGVRVRSEGPNLVLRATDRYRMAIATIPWQPGSASAEVDALIPATLLAEVGKQVNGSVSIGVDANRLALTWDDMVVTTAVLDGSYLTETKLALADVDTHVELDADTFSNATRRVALFTDTRGVVSVEVGDTHLRLRTADRQTGEAEESVKATIDGGRTSPSYQARYLIDALRPFAGRRVHLAIQPGMRATVVTAVEPGEVDLRYIIMPMLPPKTT